MTACTSWDFSEVEVDAPPMRQGETEGREGALGYSCRRVRSLRRNDTVTANRRVCDFIGKTQLNISLLHFKARCFKAPLELWTPSNASCWGGITACQSVEKYVEEKALVSGLFWSAYIQVMKWRNVRLNDWFLDCMYYVYLLIFAPESVYHFAI